MAPPQYLKCRTCGGWAEGVSTYFPSDRDDGWCRAMHRYDCAWCNATVWTEEMIPEADIREEVAVRRRAWRRREAAASRREARRVECAELDAWSALTRTRRACEGRPLSARAQRADRRAQRREGATW